jgi:hypothetical protein
MGLVQVKHRESTAALFIFSGHPFLSLSLSLSAIHPHAVG